VESLLRPELASVLAIWLLAVVSPGPAFLVMSQAAMGRSRPAAIGTAFGITTGAMLYAALTLWGFTAVVVQIAWLGTALRIAGALYLVYLGLLLFQSASAAPATDEPEAARAGDARSGYRVGLLTALTNPKSIAFFLSLFAVALPPEMTSGAKWALLAAGFLIEIGWYLLVAFVLSSVGPRRLYARVRATVDRVLGAGLLLLGVRIGTADH
jgi:threonine/homoserine/homoserine lactone efflux protein